MSRFSKNSANNWKYNKGTQVALQTSMFNKPFIRPRKETSVAKNAKEVTYSPHALNNRIVCQTKGMKS